jgi:hypothetical protein
MKQQQDRHRLVLLFFCLGMVGNFHVFVSKRAPSFARALCGRDAISLSFHKEMAKEKELRGKPLRTLQCA